MTWRRYKRDLGGNPLVYYRWDSANGDLKDLAPADKISEALGSDGTSHLHLTNRNPTYAI